MSESKDIASVEEVVGGLVAVWAYPGLHAPGLDHLRNKIDVAIALLQSQSAKLSALEKDAGRWVPWSKGDALPPYGRYACTFTQHSPENDYEEPWVLWADSLNEGKSTDSFWWPKINCGEQLIAYWSVPLPKPYSGTAIDLARGQS